jgi:purine-binding chemotaxis protein CheW
MIEFKEKKELQLIVFALGKEEYTVPIESVQEIIMPQKTTYLPKAPSFIEGVINLRGHVIPIIDGRKRFGLSVNEDSLESRIIVLELEKHTVGLIVDAVSEVVYLKTDSIEPAPIDMGDNNFILGIGKVKERLLILLDPYNFLEVHETESIQKSIESAKCLVESSKELQTT